MRTMSIAVKGCTAADCGAYAINRADSLGVMECTGLPFSETHPWVGLVKPAITFSRVLFPAPLGPTIPRTFPARHPMLTSSTSVLPRTVTVTPLASMVTGSESSVLLGAAGSDSRRMLVILRIRV